jgi:hypothetical protein
MKPLLVGFGGVPARLDERPFALMVKMGRAFVKWGLGALSGHSLPK